MNEDLSFMAHEATKLLSKLIAIPSISREEEQAANEVQQYLEEQGMVTGR